MCFLVAEKFKIPLREIFEWSPAELELYAEWFRLKKQWHDDAVKEAEAEAERKRKRKKW